MCPLRAERSVRLLLVILLLTSLGHAAAKKSRKTQTPAGSFPAVDAIMRQAIAEERPPGAAVLIGHNGQVVFRRAYGHRTLVPAPEPMTLDTIFDIASMTKPLATAMSVMRLVELGQVRLNDPVVRYLPEFGQNGKEEITVRQLMIHYSGLPEDLDLRTPWRGSEQGFRMAMEEKPVDPPGARFRYSDINYIVLGFLVERVSGMSLDKYAEAHIFAPLGMTHTRFLPPDAWRPKIAATEYDERGVMLRGVVHDPSARRMGGVAGHAGLFSTADDLAKFAQAMIDRGGKVLSPLTIEKMTTPQQPPSDTSVRGLGWDIDSPYSTNRGELLPVGSFGHTGFTGTSLWIDPVTNTYIIILGNGVHPRGGMPLISLRSKVATAVASELKLTLSEKDKVRLARITGYNESGAASRRISARNAVVKTGIDVLEEHNFSELRPGQNGEKRHIGLLTNQTGLDSQGRRTIDVLAHAPGISLDAIFSPEHGITGALDTTDVSNTRDAATGITVYTIYGGKESARRPSAAQLKGLSAVVVDIQDAGVRFYTYPATLGYFLEATKQAGIELVVLDRPDPINGADVQGPVSDPGTESFVNYFPVPVRHGMTMGELARLYSAEKNLRGQLTVVAMQNWERGDWFDSTGVTWVNTSPNLRSLLENTLYPGVGMVEYTNVSVGRGTDTPFEVLGAPWIHAQEFAQYLNSREIQGVRFVPVNFTPTSSNYANQACGGVNLVLMDRNKLDAAELGIELASALQKLYPEQYKIDKMIDILANQAVFKAIVAGEDPRRIAEEWREATEAFQKMRERYLLYR